MNCGTKALIFCYYPIITKSLDQLHKEFEEEKIKIKQFYLLNYNYVHSNKIDTIKPMKRLIDIENKQERTE